MKLLIYAVLTGVGFVNLATEMLVPRVFASIFGTSSTVWAVVISATLLGCATGYAVGGRIGTSRSQLWVHACLFLAAFWLLLIPVLLRYVLPSIALNSTSSFAPVAITLLFVCFPISFCCSAVGPPLLDRLLLIDGDSRAALIASNVLCVSTIGSVAGALVCEAYLIPELGLSLSIRLLSVLLLFFSLLLVRKSTHRIPAIVGLGAVFSSTVVIEQQLKWSTAHNIVLHRESRYQTIRVVDDEFESRSFYFGPTLQARVDRRSKESWFGFTLEIVRLVGENLSNEDALILGGAGHSIAHALEQKGANVTEVEIDPAVIQVSDAYFGRIKGKNVTEDARVYLQQSDFPKFDTIVLDAFEGEYVPYHLSSKEFFAAVSSRLKPYGKFYINFIGATSGPRSAAFAAVTSTAKSVFAFVQSPTRKSQNTTNTVIVLSNFPFPLVGFADSPSDGVILTDDRNSLEWLVAESGRHYDLTGLAHY